MPLPEIEELLRDIKADYTVVTDMKRLAAAADYAAEDVLSENATTGTPYQFNMGCEYGVIEKAVAFCSVTALTPQITVYLFTAKPTGALNDNVANTNPTEANSTFWEGQIDFLAMEDLGGGSGSVITVGTYGNLPFPFYAPARVLYGVAVTRQAITGEAVGMTLRFSFQVKKLK